MKIIVEQVCKGQGKNRRQKAEGRQGKNRRQKADKKKTEGRRQTRKKQKAEGRQGKNRRQKAAPDFDFRLLPSAFCLLLSAF
jgi:hypothetical protein